MTRASILERTRSQFIVPRPSELHPPPVQPGGVAGPRPGGDTPSRPIPPGRTSVLRTETWEGRLGRGALRLASVVLVGVTAAAIAALAILILTSLGP